MLHGQPLLSSITLIARPKIVLPILIGMIPFGLLVVFILHYQTNVPLIDEIYLIDIVTAAASGQFEARMMLQGLAGHPVVLPNLINILLARFAAWDLRADDVINIGLTAATFTLLLALVFRIEPRAVIYMGVIGSTFLFSVQQDYIWLVSYYSMWYLTPLLTVLAVTVIATDTNKPRAFVAATMCAALATFSMANGVLLWAIIFVMLVLHRYRWTWLVALALVALGVIGVLWFGFVDNIQGELNYEAERSLRVSGSFALGFLGNLAAANDLSIAIRVAIVGAVVVLVDVIYLVGVAKYRKIVTVWMPIALLPVGTAVLASFQRPYWYLNGAHAAFNYQYRTSSGLLWTVAAFVIVLVVWHVANTPRPRWWQMALSSVNMVLAAGITFLFIIATYQVMHPAMGDWLYHANAKHLEEDCYYRYLYVQDAAVIDTMDDCFVWADNWVNQLAIHRLALMSELSPTMILPQYTEGSLVLIEDVYGWVTYHIADWLLEDVPPTNILHLTSDVFLPVHNSIDTSEWITSGNTDDIMAHVENTSSLWYIRTAIASPIYAELHDTLLDAGFTATDLTWSAPFGLDFLLRRYERLTPTEAEVDFYLGDQLELLATRLPDGNLQACDTWTVKTFWQASTPLPVPYSITYTLLNATGETIARSDGQLTYVPSNTWEVGRTYLDERQFALPCDLPLGTYTVAVGVYDYRDGIRLLVRPPKGEQAGDLAQIVTVPAEQSPRAD